MHILSGKGMYLWVIWRVEGGRDGAPPDPELIADAAEDAGLTHVWIKVADSSWPYNIHHGVDLVPGVVEALHNRGIEAWGWQYIYGYPENEAKVAIRRVTELGLDGFVVNAEKEFKAGPHMAGVAKRYMEALRAGLPSTRIGFSSFKYPDYHRELPWHSFAPYIDFWAPQVYWIQAQNPAWQLAKSITEHRKIADLPIIPTGAAYKEHGWISEARDVQEFLEACIAQGVPAANFWEWRDARVEPYGFWEVIKNFVWPGDESRKDEETDPQVDDVEAWRNFQKVAREAGQDVPV